MHDALTIRTSREGSTATVAVAGEIDLSTVDELRSAVTGAADDGIVRLLLDLSDVEFIDSAGLGVLLELRATLRGEDVVLGIAAGGPVRQAMAITGLSELLDA